MPFSLGFWATAGAETGPVMELISTTVLASTATSVNFSSIPQNYRALQIRAVTKGTTADTNINSLLTFNGLAGSNYSFHRILSTGTGSSRAVGTNQASIIIGISVSRVTTANAFGAAIIDVLQYTANANKTVRAAYGQTDSTDHISLLGGQLMDANPIQSLNLAISVGSYAIGSRFSLYGVK